jgi:hypothetical protein
MDMTDLKYIVGAYATAPSLGIEDKNLELRYYEEIKSLSHIRGLEIPFWGEEIHRFGSDFLLDIIQPDWENVLSCIPGTAVGGLASNAKFGIASDDLKWREEAVAMHKRANQMLHKMNDRFGRQSILAVQLATGPSVPVEGVSSSKESLLRSMEEILCWDWDGARVVIEHCDASNDGRPNAKGFLPLDQEIEVLQSLACDHEVGVLINWARSAIEGRDSNKPIEHLKMATQHKLLSGLIFSGVSSVDDQYGSWSDSHMPFAQSFGVKHFEVNSLLTQEAIQNSLAVVELEKLDYIGVKLLSMPLDSQDIKRRIGLNEDGISILNKIINSRY